MPGLRSCQVRAHVTCQVKPRAVGLNIYKPCATDVRGIERGNEKEKKKFGSLAAAKGCGPGHCVANLDAVGRPRVRFSFGTVRACWEARVKAPLFS